MKLFISYLHYQRTVQGATLYVQSTLRKTNRRSRCCYSTLAEMLSADCYIIHSITAVAALWDDECEWIQEVQ